jgi:DNA invertase Pin-like site-specific DNA recombinase
MIIGYARVSTQDQNLDLQIDALKKAGCEKIYSEKVSSVKDRPQLDKLIENLRPNDKVIVWKLDRLGRSVKDLITIVTTLHAINVSFQSITDNIDTTTTAGRLMFNIFGALAEFERDTIRERTKAGLEAARARGRNGGRKNGLSKTNQSKADTARILYAQKNKTVDEIASDLGVGRATIYRWIK